MAKPNNVNEYISGFPEETQALLQQLRATVLKAAPGPKKLSVMECLLLNCMACCWFVCRVCKAHWLVPQSFRNRSIQKRTVCVQKVQKVLFSSRSINLSR